MKKQFVFNNTIFVSGPMRPHNVNTEIQKVNIYDIPISYLGDNTLFGVIYIDEKMDNNLYPNGVTINIEFTVFPLP